MDTKIAYNYWTGTQWIPQEIAVPPAMTTGWHIFHVIMTLCSFGLWGVLIYLPLYLSAVADYKKKVRAAQQEIDAYNKKLGLTS